MKSILYLCGAGNAEGVRLAVRINERNPQWEKIVILDDDPAKKGLQKCGIDIVGSFDVLKNADPKQAEVANLVARTTKKRKGAYEKISAYGIPFASLIDPEVDIWGVTWSGDVTVYRNVTFSAGAHIDGGTVVFTGAVIGHGCSVGKFCVVAPGAVLNARVKLDEGVYVGTNASILPDLSIGAWATVGFNTGVMENIPAGATAVGVPAQILIPPKKTAAPGTDDAQSGEPLPAQHSYDQDAVESMLAGLWAKVLSVGTVDIDDNFFDLGGDSIMAVGLHTLLRETEIADCTLVDIFRFPTVRRLAAFIFKQHAFPGDGGLATGSKRVQFARQRFSKGNSPADLNRFQQ